MKNYDKNKLGMKYLKSKKQKSVKYIISFFVLFIIAIFVALSLYVNNNDGKNRIAKGVKVFNVNLSNCTKKQAINKLNEEFNILQDKNVTLQIDNKDTVLTLKSMGFKLKDTTIKSLTNDAYNYGKKGLLIKRFFDIKKAKKNSINIETDFEINDKIVKSIIVNKLPEFKNGAKNATFKIEGEKATIVKEKKGKIVDEDKCINLINNVLSDWNFKDIKINVPYKTGSAKIKYNDLKNSVDLLASFKTMYETGTSSATNIEAGAKYVSNIIVFPDDEISVNDLMSPYTEERGFTMARSYSGGGVVTESMGGGICQVSTTLYNALIFAEVDITERSPHSSLIQYVYPGRDAAIDEGYKDLKFKNNYKYPIYIYGYAKNGEVYFAIYGKEIRKSNRTISFESEVDKNEKEDAIKKAKDEYNKALSENKSEEEAKKIRDDAYLKYTNENLFELSVKLYKIIYENGNEISREKFSDSLYYEKKKTFEEVIEEV